jgi:hypothetical protein
MASVEAIGEPGARRRRRGGKRWSGKREGATSMRVGNSVIVYSGGGGAHEDEVRMEEDGGALGHLERVMRKWARRLETACGLGGISSLFSVYSSSWALRKVVKPSYLMGLFVGP